MPLQTSGQISLNEIHIEAGGTGGTQASINDSDIRGLIGKGSGVQMAFNEWYGAANYIFDASQDAAVYGRTVNSFNSTYGSGGGNATTWAMSCGGTSGVSIGSTSENLLSGIYMTSGVTYDMEYDMTLSGYSSIQLAVSYSALTGFTSPTQTSGALTSIHTVSTGGRQSGTFQYTPTYNAYVGLKLIVGTQGNGNPLSGSCTVHSYKVKAA